VKLVTLLSFRPSEALQKPYVVVSLPILVADTDAEAARQQTTGMQRFLSLIRGEELYLKPPVENMQGMWNAMERETVMARIGRALRGSVETVSRKLTEFVARAAADEILAVMET